MKCESCWTDLDPTVDIVEWLALRNGVNIVGSIRVVHKDCTYYNTQKKKLIQENLFDRWLPLKDLKELMVFALEMNWDNRYDSELKLLDIIESTKKQEVTNG